MRILVVRMVTIKAPAFAWVDMSDSEGSVLHGPSDKDWMINNGVDHRCTLVNITHSLVVIPSLYSICSSKIENIQQHDCDNAEIR